MQQQGGCSKITTIHLLKILRSSRPKMGFTDDQHGWILSNQGLLRTQDGGKTWNWQQGSEQDRVNGENPANVLEPFLD